jgi:hypothetical protein
MNVCLVGFGQQQLGIQNSNYSGIQGSLLNPSSIADSKLKFDVNFFSWDVTFANDFLYAPKSALNFLGFKRIIKGAIDEDLFLPRYDNKNPNKLYNVTFSTEILGPSFFIKIKNKHELGLTIAARANANVRDITGNVAINAFDYLVAPVLWNTDFHDNTARMNVMGWLEYGAHYATILYDDGKDQIKGGITLKYLQGIAAAYFKNVHINYNIADTNNIAFANTSLDYGRTNYDDFKGNHPHHTTHGHGFGMDLGFTWVHRLDNASYSNHTNGQLPANPDKIDYQYKIGLSLIDIGSIRYGTNTAAYHLQADAADFSNWHQLAFSGNAQVDRTLSAVFYNGDSTKSQTGDHFSMALPSALSIQADYNFGNNVFANATIIKGFGHGNNNGTTRPDIYSITPRYEKRMWEVSVPFSVISYGHTQLRTGMAVRYRYFFIGGDAPASLLKLHDLNGVDFYAGVHYFIPEKGSTH